MPFTAFLNAVKANTGKYYWTGRITTKGGAAYDFDQDAMVKGSGYITSQCCGSTEIELGTVYAVEMGISLFSDIDRYTLEDAIITLSYHLQMTGGSYEEIPMGIFEVSEANRKAKFLEIKAYDYMVRFEKVFLSDERAYFICDISTLVWFLRLKAVKLSQLKIYLHLLGIPNKNGIPIRKRCGYCFMPSAFEDHTNQKVYPF